MSVHIPEDVQQRLAAILTTVEGTSELTRCVVVTRSGIKVAPDMDADTYSASSAALIDLGERVVSSLNHGSLQELLINALGGYVILVAIGKDYMLLGATSARLKMGYYLPYLKKTAWVLEEIIYGEAVTGLEEMEAESGINGAGSAEEETKITMEDIQAADMAAMDDVLAAFDEFGINDDFDAGLGEEAVPSVSISNEEMEEINKQLQSEQEEIPDFSTTSISTQPEVTDVVESSTVSSEGECPIPLEPGEVAPYPLSPEQLNPFGSMDSGVEEPVQPAPVEPAQPVQPIEPAQPVVQPQPSIEAQPTPKPASHPPPTQPTPPTTPSFFNQAAAQPAAPEPEPSKEESLPFFSDADEYDFDFDMDKDAGKDVVIQEKDSMSDALKALGWEEEDS